MQAQHQAYVSRARVHWRVAIGGRRLRRQAACLTDRRMRIRLAPQRDESRHDDDQVDLACQRLSSTLYISPQ
jgi:hypothetical protein